MTTAPSPLEQDLAALELSYSRTVDRTLVHRDSLGEVFLTDLQPLGGASYVAAAQLPRSHAYYGDHLLNPNVYDPVLLLEACRQAALAGAHAYFAVPRTHKFILTHLRVHLSRPDRIAVGPTPCQLTLHVTTSNHYVREGSTNGLDYDVDLRVGDVSIGRAGIGLRFKSPESYTALRLRNRDQRPLPSSADHPAPGTATGAPVEPYRVGRANADNVVLTGIEVAGDTLTAGIRTPGSHPSMFDHPQDHLPGMVIAEAARQIALYGALDVRGMSPSRTYPTGLAVTFSRFGELDSPATLTAVVGERRDAGRPGEPASYYTQGGIVELGDENTPDTDRVPVRVEAHQDGESLCLLTLDLARVRTPR
ncbi:ScbA/BarX family gamma-butyrolactone biosynthesis protein [Streptomyces sp. NPDC054840]